MKILFVLSFLMLVACGKNSNPGSFNGDGLTTAVYTQESGFVDVQICGIDVHQMPNGQIYNCAGNAYSQTSNVGYALASDGYYKFTNYALGACWFYITSGAFDQTNSAIAPTFYQKR